MSQLDLGLLPSRETLVEGVILLRSRAGEGVLAAVQAVLAAAPPRVMMTPMGKPMSVAMTSCGALGWVSDATGYRYDAVDPVSGKPWPGMPVLLRALACETAAEAGFAGFDPNACLINRYRDGARMGLHQDRDEMDFSQPVVSVSLGRSALFRFGGVRRGDPTRSVRLDHGDVVVFGGPARLMLHGVDRLLPGDHPTLGDSRINLTFRRAVPTSTTAADAASPRHQP
jgi:alkylated DNA repair protein (DNA oxidative demethylase)